jgi:putative ABC transport system permease protein
MCQMDGLLIEIRYAVRSLLRRPALAALAVLTLAVGVGANTVAFSAIDALLFHPLAFRDVDRLGWVMLNSPNHPDGHLSSTEFDDLRRTSRAFDAVAASAAVTLALDSDGRAEQIFASLVSPNFFEAIGARAEIGRTLTSSDASLLVQIPAVVSHRFWRNALGGAAIDGKTLTIGGRLVSIVGVMPDAFQGPTGVYAPEIWLPLDRVDVLGIAGEIRKPTYRWLGAFARLAPGANVSQAQTELAGYASRWKAAGPLIRNGRSDVSARFYPMRDGHPELQAIAPYAWLTMATVGIVLLLACFNVTALLLTRASERRREIGVRLALGAGRARVIRGLLIEGLLLAAASGAAALVVAAWSERLLAVFALPAPEPQRLRMGIDARLVEFTGALVLLAGVLPALLPAVHATGRGITRSMRLDAGFGDGRPSRARNCFVIAQIAGSTLFLAVALLCVRSFLDAAAFNPGVDVDRTVVANLDPMHYGMDTARTRVLLDVLLQRLAASPAIAQIAAADRVPFSVGYPHVESVAVPGEACADTECRAVLTYAVTSGHFATFGMRMVDGRELTPAEVRAGSAVVINEALAAARFPSGRAVGQTLLIGRPAHAVQIAGVVTTINQYRVGETSTPVLYRSLTDGDLAHGFALIARASGDPRAAAIALRDTIGSTAPGVPPAAIDGMRDRLALPLWPYRTGAGFFLTCGTLALLLATVGLFGATYFTVCQRTREFGIRIAIGARQGDVMRQVLAEGLRLSVPGALLGLTAALVVGRLLSRLLVGVSPSDPLSFGGAVAIQIAVGLMACVLPARRATQADPVIALRVD